MTENTKLPLYSATIDWVSFTLPLDIKVSGGLLYKGEFMRKAVRSVLKQLGPLSFLFETYNLGTGRWPYDECLVSPDTQARLYIGYSRDHVLIELSGKSCRYVRERHLLAKLLKMARSTCTRVDICLDVHCSDDPVDVASSFSGNFVKNVQHNISDEGITAYLGSPKSDRRLRIYRYHPPHERSDYMRFEWQYRRHYVPRFFSSIDNKSFIEFIAGEMIFYDFRHPTVLAFLEVHKGVRNDALAPLDKKTPNTMKWLEKACAPAIRRMIREGHIEDPLQWFQDVVLSCLYD